jgi:(p)ppGpp synthase/HD superfamily hydrolase
MPPEGSMLSSRYKDAMMFAAQLHDRQTRKGTEVAYLTHLMSVSALVMENGGDEEQGIAALLHDALEDQGAEYESEYLQEPRNGRAALKRDIELKYGSRVLAIVIGCTDDEDFAKPPEGERGSIDNWRSRKLAYIEHINHTTDVGLLRVSCADKLHNARTILLDLYEHGAAVWSRFRSANRENVLWYYGSLAKAFTAKASSTADSSLKRLSAELGRTVELIEAYRSQPQ